VEKKRKEPTGEEQEENSTTTKKTWVVDAPEQAVSTERAIQGRYGGEEAGNGLVLGQTLQLQKRWASISLDDCH
jgi:hypothetical protein